MVEPHNYRQGSSSVTKDIKARVSGLLVPGVDSWYLSSYVTL